MYLAKCPLAGMAALSKAIPPAMWPTGASHWMVLVMSPTGMCLFRGVAQDKASQVNSLSLESHHALATEKLSQSQTAMGMIHAHVHSTLHRSLEIDSQ